MKRVLISEPNASGIITFMPYIWGILKTASEQEPELSGQLDWLDPIYERASAADSLARYDLQTIDVLGLSCYTWNFELQCEIAGRVKAANPACLTVAGGPHPDVKDPDFFRKHPHIDIVVSKDGEVTFSALLLSLCRGERDYRHIPGLYLPDGTNRDVVHTGAPQLPSGFRVSPYLAQSDYYDKIIAESPSLSFGTTWETTRGCPYSCSFCDWGSNTMSKIRQFDLERVQSEVEWLFSRRINTIFLSDANFGILPRDLTITDWIGAAVSKSMYKTALSYSTAKNNPERSLEISKKLTEFGLQCEQNLSLQHAIPEVLGSVDRKNISPARQMAFATGLVENEIKVTTQLIMGIPGDSYSDWKASLLRLPEWHLHRDPSIYHFNLLPNAPASAPEYRAKWEIDSIFRVGREIANFKNKKDDIGIPQEIIVSTVNFSRADWVKMNVFTALYRAIHAGGVSSRIAVFMYRSHNVSFQAFYEFVIEQYIAKTFLDGQLHDMLVRIYENVLENEDSILDQTILPELEDDSFTMSVSQAALVQIAMDLDVFIDGLTDAMRTRFPEVDGDMLSSLAHYQHNMVVLPEYDVANGKRFALAHDWPAYFAKADGAGSEKLPEPAAVTAIDALVEDRMWTTESFPRGPEWTGQEGPARWRRWAEFAMNYGDRVALVLHQQVRLVPASAPHEEQKSAETRYMRNLIRTLAPTWLKTAVRRTEMSG